MSDGLFLGRDPSTQADVRLTPSRLRTHGVVVGMTGSGKTGLCLVMLEELVRSGVPIIAIDPKGDLGNLGLLFNNLAADEFKPWCGEADPQGLADRWTSGLGKWGIDKTDVAATNDNMRMTVYTPGSESGVPVDLLGAFARPDESVLADAEARRDLVADTVSGLLGLVGRNTDAVKDPAHIVLSQILDQAWAAGEDPDLETLIMRLVDPPFEKVGVFGVDRFFKPDDRMDLAMLFNGVVASPSFAPWTTGARIDIDAMLDRSGPIGVHVFSIAHLDDNERQFFVSLLLGQVLAWSRAQPGSDDLRAVLFFDEVAGYLPPHPARPPTKAPLLTMMKQARAVGLGVLLATQNPVDIDYKALSNAGLWCIGRLSTPQDRERLLKGIEVPGLDGTVAGLEKRQFLIHQVGKAEPVVAASRHAMCYLRGPFTRVEYARLNAFLGAGHVAIAVADNATHIARPGSDAGPAAAPTPSAPSTPAKVDDGLLPAPPTVEGLNTAYLDGRVAFSARMDGAFASHAEAARDDGQTVMRPALYADLSVRFDEDRVGFVVDERIRSVWFPLGDAPEDEALAVRLEDDDFDIAPDNARYGPLPTWMDEPKEVARLKKRVIDDVYRGETRGMFVNTSLKMYGKGGETKEAFDARCRDAVEDIVDDQLAKIHAKYEKQGDRVEDRIQSKRAKLIELEGVAKSRQLEEAVNVGATILSFFGGRKKSMSGAVTKRRQTAQAQQKLTQLEAEIARLEEDAADVEEALANEAEQIRADAEDLLGESIEKEVRLEKTDIQLRAFGVLWVPVTRRI